MNVRFVGKNFVEQILTMLLSSKETYSMTFSFRLAQPFPK